MCIPYVYNCQKRGAAGEDVGEELKAIKEQMRQVPERGIGYGILRYLHSGDIGEELKRQRTAEVSFNYLGQFDQAIEAGRRRPTSEPSGPLVSPQGSRVHLIDVVGSISGGRLYLMWSYSQAIHSEETIRGLALDYIQALQLLIEHCQSPEAGGYTPSDFPEAEISQKDIDKLMNKRKQKKVK